MVKDLENNILSGLVLVVLVLMFALGFRNALFVGAGDPVLDARSPSWCSSSWGRR